MRRRFCWGAVTGLLVFVGFVLFKRLFQRQSVETLPSRTVEYVIPYEAEEDEAEEPAVTDLSVKVEVHEASASRERADDLTKIEGLGPKSAQVLLAAGILSYEQLAESSVENLRYVLSGVGLRIVYPDTWPEQASLAAAGDWEGLKALQARLDRGRRIKS